MQYNIAGRRTDHTVNYPFVGKDSQEETAGAATSIDTQQTSVQVILFDDGQYEITFTTPPLPSATVNKNTAATAWCGPYNIEHQSPECRNSPNTYTHADSYPQSVSESLGGSPIRGTIDPTRPNVLSGSLPIPRQKGTETVSWDLTRVNPGECSVTIYEPLPKAQWVFDDNKPGAIKGKLSAVAVPHSLANQIEWTLPAINGSTLTTTPDPPRGPEVQFKYEGLPDKNSEFGSKTIEARIVSSTARCHTSQSVRLFFGRDASNSPGSNNGKVPNWFYYWKQTSAAQGHTADAIRYGGGGATNGCGPGDLGFFNGYANLYAADWIYVCDLKQSDFKSVNGLIRPPVSAEGIDVFGVTVLHEWTHLLNFKEWWAWPDQPAEYRPTHFNDNEGPCLLPLLQRPAPPARYKYDCDADHIPDVFEGNLGMNPQLWDTCGIGMSDNECVAAKAEARWRIGSANKEDWACPGKQADRPCQGGR
ncbi:MAG: hypothetical protein HZB53_18935 [Chloroflexi bacterium]|nr:hypothetical protein [Chloroflexota bacterium]